jgi:hypothetical protein
VAPLSLELEPIAGRCWGVATRSSGMGAARARIVVTSGVGDGGGHRKTPAEDRACRSCGEVFTWPA